MHNHKSCAECAFSAQPRNPDPFFKNYLECRRRPPHAEHEWPYVAYVDWCGEFERSHEVEEREIT